MRYTLNLNSIHTLGVIGFIATFFAYNYLIAIDERLFDICLLVSILIFLLRKYDFPSILLSVFITFRLWDEASQDDGQINVLDTIELIIVFIITTYNFFKYKFPHGTKNNSDTL